MKYIVKVNEEGLALLKAASMVVEIIWSEEGGTKKTIQAVEPEAKMKRRRGRRFKYGRNPFLRVGKPPAEGNLRTGAINARLLMKHLAENQLKMISRRDWSRIIAASGDWPSISAGYRAIKQALDKGWIEAVE